MKNSLPQGQYIVALDLNHVWEVNNAPAAAWSDKSVLLLRIDYNILQA